MKKLMFCTVIAFMMLASIPTQLKASDNTKTVIAVSNKPDVSTEASQAARLEEIKAMDMSTLSRSEKKELRNEVKAIKSTQDEIIVTHHHHGAYYGVGGVLLIVLIIILIV